MEFGEERRLSAVFPCQTARSERKAGFAWNLSGSAISGIYGSPGLLDVKRFQWACLPRLWAGTRVRGPCPGGRQKMRVCPEACSLFWAALSLACFWYSRCRLEQAWHRVSSGMGGAPHSTQMPRSLALSLLSWVLRRINSLRSGVWARWRSYSRRFSCLASSSARVGSTRGFGVLGSGVAFRDVFTAGLFQLWGCPPQGNRVLIAPRFGIVALWGLTSPGSLSIFTCYSQNSWESIGISTIR